MAAIDPITAIAVIGQIYSMFSSSAQAEKQGDLSEAALRQQQEWLEKAWQYQEPLLQQFAAINQGMKPTFNQMIGQIANLAGVTPGTAIPLPKQANPEIPEYLRTAMDSPNDNLRLAAEAALYNKWDKSQWADILKDAGSGGDYWAQVNRRIDAGMGKPLPADWETVKPQTTTGGQALYVPTNEQLPTWMQQDTSIPDYMKPYTPEQLTSLREGVDIPIEQASQRMAGDIASSLQRRGLGGIGATSSLEGSLQAGLGNWRTRALGEVNAGLTREQQGRADTRSLFLENLGQQRKSQTQNTYTNLMNILQGKETSLYPAMNMEPYTQAAGNQAAIYANQRNAWAQQAGQAGANLGATLGSMSAWNNYVNSQNRNTGNMTYAWAQPYSTYPPRTWGQ